MGDNHDNENHEALPQQPPYLAQAVAPLIADSNEQTELIRQLVQAQVNAGSVKLTYELCFGRLRI